MYQPAEGKPKVKVGVKIVHIWMGKRYRVEASQFKLGLGKNCSSINCTGSKCLLPSSLH